MGQMYLFFNLVIFLKNSDFEGWKYPPPKAPNKIERSIGGNEKNYIFVFSGKIHSSKGTGISDALAGPSLEHVVFEESFFPKQR